MDLPGSPTLTVNTRFSGISFDGPLSECGGGLASLPSSPLLPTSPVGANFLGGMPRSTSGQSIPIFFQPDDLNSSRGSRVENPFEVEENGGEDDDDASGLAPDVAQSATSSSSSTLSSAASFDSLATTFFLPIPGETTISVLIDQEGFREALVEFEYTGTDEQSGLLEFVAKMPAIGRERDGWPFHVGFLQTPPYLRRLAITADPSRDYLPREACLPITEKDGVYKVSSARSAPTSSSSNSNTGAQPYYCLAYEVKERLNLVGQRMKGERLLKPLVFICSRDFLSPVRGRRIGLIELMAKTFTLPATATLVKHTPKRPATRG
ncbi:hypothetical protein JCM10213v2_002506 [Rhodosporidiobolus nylandii]